MGWGPGPARRHLRTSRPTSSRTEMCPFNRDPPCCPLPSLSTSYNGFVLCDHTRSSTDLVGPTCKMLTAAHPQQYPPTLRTCGIRHQAQLVNKSVPRLKQKPPTTGLGKEILDGQKLTTSQGKSGALSSITCLLGPTLPRVGSSSGSSVQSRRPRCTPPTPPPLTSVMNRMHSRNM